MLRDAQSVLDLKPDYAALRGMAVGAVGPYAQGAPCAFGQGTRMQRSGRVHVERIGEDTWIGGAVCAVVDGTIVL